MRNARRMLRRVACVVVVGALLLAAPVARAEEAPPPTAEGSTLQYFVKATFFTSLAMLAFVFIWAACTPAEDATGVSRALGEIDQALARGRGEPPSELQYHNKLAPLLHQRGGTVERRGFLTWRDHSR